MISLTKALFDEGALLFGNNHSLNKPIGYGWTVLAFFQMFYGFVDFGRIRMTLQFANVQEFLQLDDTFHNGEEDAGL